MGNVLKKEKDPLEDAKRKAAKRRATKLKQKRRSTMHTREWDPSGDIGDGPTVGIGGQLELRARVKLKAEAVTLTALRPVRCGAGG